MSCFLQHGVAVAWVLEDEFMGRFSGHLAHYLADLRGMEARVRKVDRTFKVVGRRRSWARPTWSLNSKDWLNKFFYRVQVYHAVFSLELLTIQTWVSSIFVVHVTTMANRL